MEFFVLTHEEARQARVAIDEHNPNPAYEKRFFVCCKGKEQRGKSRGLATCQVRSDAEWICERLAVAEKHDPGVRPPR